MEKSWIDVFKNRRIQNGDRVRHRSGRNGTVIGLAVHTIRDTYSRKPKAPRYVEAYNVLFDDMPKGTREKSMYYELDALQ